MALQENASSKVIAAEILPQVQNKILEEMEEIIDKLIEKAKDGSCAKFLFQFTGVPAIELRKDGEPEVDGAALADRFLRELMGEPEPSQQPEVKGMNL